MAARPISCTHFPVYYAVFSLLNKNLRHAIYVHTDGVPVGKSKARGTLLQINGDLSLPTGRLTFSARDCTTPLKVPYGICLRPVGWASRGSISEITKTCANIPLATKLDDGPAQLPSQPPRNSEEWTNMAIAALIAAKLLLPLGCDSNSNSKSAAVILHSEADTKVITKLTLCRGWRGWQDLVVVPAQDVVVPVPAVHPATPVPVVHPAPPVPDVHPAPPVPDVHSAPPVPAVHPAPPVPDVHSAPPMPDVHSAPSVPDVHSAPPVPVVHPAPPVPAAAPGQGGGVPVPAVVVWEEKLRLVVLSFLLFVTLSAADEWMRAVSCLLFIFLLIH